MKLSELETEALRLPVAERADLAQTLLESLDELSEDEHRQLWAEEAARRDAEPDADSSRGRAAEAFRPSSMNSPKKSSTRLRPSTLAPALASATRY
jgi:hypothetical protein